MIKITEMWKSHFQTLIILQGNECFYMGNKNTIFRFCHPSNGFLGLFHDIFMFFVSTLLKTFSTLSFIDDFETTFLDFREKRQNTLHKRCCLLSILRSAHRFRRTRKTYIFVVVYWWFWNAISRKFHQNTNIKTCTDLEVFELGAHF